MRSIRLPFEKREAATAINRRDRIPAVILLQQRR
jgi:hypothetical protein